MALAVDQGSLPGQKFCPAIYGNVLSRKATKKKKPPKKTTFSHLFYSSTRMTGEFFFFQATLSGALRAGKKIMVDTQ